MEEKQGTFLESQWLVKTGRVTVENGPGAVW